MRRNGAFASGTLTPNMMRRIAQSVFSTNARSLPSPRTVRFPKIATYFFLFLQNLSNSAGSVCPSESVWKMKSAS